MSSEPENESHFARRWQRWHRLGWPAYLLVSVARYAATVALILFCCENLFAHGIAISEWRGLHERNYCFILGFAYFSVTQALDRYRNNEQRYAQIKRPPIP